MTNASEHGRWHPGGPLYGRGGLPPTYPAGPTPAGTGPGVTRLLPGRLRGGREVLPRTNPPERSRPVRRADGSAGASPPPWADCARCGRPYRNAERWHVLTIEGRPRGACPGCWVALTREAGC